MALARSTVLLKPSSALSTKGDRALVTNTTSQNVAEENSFQINGHIASEVHNYSCGTLIVNYFPSTTSRTRARLVKDALTSKPVSENVGSSHKLRLPTRDKPSAARKNQLYPEQRAKKRHRTISEPDGIHDLILSSSISGKKGVVCATKRIDCQRNYIADRIVRRFALTSHIDGSANTSTIVTGGYRITPSRSYVILAASAAVQNRLNPHHFYIVEHCLNFDVLIGSEIITNLSTSD